MLPERYNLIARAMHYIALACMIASLPGCKKDPVDEPSPEPTDEIISPTTGTRKEFTLDSIFLYARQTYLWYDALPTYDQFGPRVRYGGINPEMTAYQTELYDISQLGINPDTGNPYESPIRRGVPRYSYLEEGTSSGASALAAVSTASPVVYYSVLQQGGEKVAYLVLGGFPRLADHQAALDEAFGDFAEAGATELVIDLRNNNGGYVETAVYVANLIASPSLNGQVMFTEEFNTLMQNGKATILRYQPYLDSDGNPVPYQGREATLADINYSSAANTFKFEKKGSYSTVKNIHFIVSGNTASAAELLISCLKPYFNIQLVGEKTYGKPVGFFGINIHSYTVYLASFLIRNAEGWHDYFDGMEPDVAIGLSTNPNWGDRDELGLKTVLSLINGDTQATTGSLPLGSIDKLQSTESRANLPTKEAIPMLPMGLKLLD